MKRKILLIFLTIISVVCLTFGVSACGKNNTVTSSGSESTISSSDQAAGDGWESFSDQNSGGSEDSNPSEGGEIHTHDLKAVTATEATCTEDGNTAYWYCGKCGKYFSDETCETEISLESTVITADGHDYDFDNIIVDWNEDYTSARATLTCKTDSSHTLNVDVEISSETTKEATCTEKGEITYTATITFGGESYYVYKPVVTNKIAHGLTPVTATEATCTEAGNNAYWHCDDCGKYFSDADGETEISLESTVIPATDHSITPVAEKEATCTEDGNTAYWYCGKCGKYFSDENGENEISRSATVISSDGHTWDEGEVTKEPTCTEKGVKTYTCTKCNEPKTEEISATGHSYNYKGVCANCNDQKTSAGLEYTISEDNTSCTITGIGTCTDSEIFIPSSCEGVTVTAIAAEAFYSLSKITSVFIPDSVTSIGYSAFAYCIKLTSVNIPESVTSVGNSAFNSCKALTKIYFDATAMSDLSTGNSVFYQAGQSGNGITVTVSANVTKIPAYIFFPYSDSTYAPKITSVVFENNSACTSIGDRAFGNCKTIESINLPDGITAIGDYAFYYCTSLTSINIPNIVTIGKNAFGYCTFTSIIIPDSVTSIANYAFSSCRSLTSVYYTGTADEWANITGIDSCYITNYGATIYYFAENDGTTTETGNYWYYDADKNIVTWSVQAA